MKSEIDSDDLYEEMIEQKEGMLEKEEHEEGL